MPFELSSEGKTWTQRPHCWHPETEEVYGKEMPLKTAITLATWAIESAEDRVENCINNLEELKDLKL